MNLLIAMQGQLAYDNYADKGLVCSGKSNASHWNMDGPQILHLEETSTWCKPCR